MMDQNGMTPLMWAAYRTHRCVCFIICVKEHSMLMLLQLYDEH